jgi:hypothetical protein
MLWLSATTGFGKSVLAAYLSKQLTTEFPSALVAYFFCKDKDSLCKYHQIIRTIVARVCFSSEIALDTAQHVWESEPSIQSRSADVDEFFNKFFVPTLQCVRSSGCELFIVLDGLNELPELSKLPVCKLLKLLQTLPSIPRTPRVRIIVTSQPDPLFNRDLENVDFLPLKSEYIAETVEKFVKHRVSGDLMKRFQKAGVEPLSLFSRHHQFMFQWVSTLLDDLEEIPTSEFETTLNCPPESISAVYQQKLNRVAMQLKKNQRPWLKEILRWILMARRDLTLLEIASATLCSAGKYEMDASEEIKWIEKLVIKCGAVLHIV